MLKWTDFRHYALSKSFLLILKAPLSSRQLGSFPVFSSSSPSFYAYPQRWCTDKWTFLSLIHVFCTCIPSLEHALSGSLTDFQRHGSVLSLSKMHPFTTAIEEGKCADCLYQHQMSGQLKAKERARLNYQKRRLKRWVTRGCSFLHSLQQMWQPHFHINKKHFFSLILAFFADRKARSHIWQPEDSKRLSLTQIFSAKLLNIQNN